MSEGVFLQPRNKSLPGLKRTGPDTFGLAGKSVSAKEGNLYRASCLNKGATVYYVQVHDKATAPIAGEIPIWEEKLPASGSWVEDFGLAGLYCANGIAFAISTTPGILTLAAADDAVLYTQCTSAG